MSSPALDIVYPAGPIGVERLAVGRFEALDGWRGVFALVIVFYHFMTMLESPLKDWRWLHSGYLMVDVFFVLSGFVIAHAYADRLHSRHDVAAFIVRRFFRVWPLHALVLLGLVVLELLKWYMTSRAGVSTHSEAFTGMYAWEGLVASVFLVHSLGLFDMPVWNVPSWSISTEFYAYLVFAVATLLVGTIWLTRLASVLVAGVLLLFLLQGFESMDITADQGFLRCLMGFFTGLLAYRVMAWLSENQPGWLLWMSYLQLPMLLWVVLYLWAVNDGVLGLYAPLAFMPFILAFASDRGYLARVMMSPVLAFLGRISYSVYLTHYLIMVFLIRLLMLVSQQGYLSMRVYQGEQGLSLAFAETWQVVLFMAASLLLVIMASSLTYRWVELPMQAVGKRWAARVRGR